MSIEQIPPADLRRLLDEGRPLVLLDVREDDERAYCAIDPPASVADLHIPMGQIAARFDEVASAEAPLVVYCHHGVRSMVVARWLSTRGVSRVGNLDGGIDAWSVQVDRGVPRY
jgi:rhodanese-related sulfurtransferase